jgi:hypothetical protein
LGREKPKITEHRGELNSPINKLTKTSNLQELRKQRNKKNTKERKNLPIQEAILDYLSE